jgi:predicted unusual protein kinase regulating ubiquinone biosynthesis (AarF/ABC1/UbiB family)
MVLYGPCRKKSGALTTAPYSLRTRKAIEERLSFKPVTGRLSRFARLAGLGARLSTQVVAKGVKKLAGSTEGLIGQEGAEKLVATLGEMKGLAMKMGQMLAMDPDQLPPEVRNVVARLQNQAPPMPWAMVREVVQRELGGTPEEKFASFEELPLASASLGQVHRAVTHDGMRVAVKVQYPDIGKAMLADLENLGSMVKVVSRGMGILEARAYFEEMRGELLKELDYEEEAARARQFAQSAKVARDLKVPQALEALTAKRVLTLELLEGETLKDVLARLPEVPPEERFRISRLLIRAIWIPLLCDGLIHADPHPGNFIVQADGHLGVLDFGAVKQVSAGWVDVQRRMFKWVLAGGPMDLVALSRQGGFTIQVPDQVAEPFIRGVVDIASEPPRSTEYDFATADTNRRMKRHMLSYATKIPQMRPPTEGLMFYRAMGGLIHDLQNLKARGNFRSIYEEIAQLIPA